MRYNLICKILIITLFVFLIWGCRKKNQSPYTPYTPIGPTTGLTETFYTFSTVAVDPNEDSVAIRFAWDNGDTSDWSTYIGSGEVVAMLYFWFNSGEYYLKAQAMDVKGLISEWSLPHSIVIIPNLPPNTPSIPAGCSLGYIESSYPFSSYTIDPDGDNVAIRFSWGDGDTSDWSSWVRSGDSVIMTHSWSFPDSYYIKAQAIDIHNKTSDWSMPHLVWIKADSFGPGYNLPPYPPSTPSGPSFGYGSILYQFSSCAIDPDSDWVAIRFYWGDGDTSGWSSWVRSGDSVKMSHAWSESDTFYIKAQAEDVHGLRSTWSGWHFIEIISDRKRVQGNFGDLKSLNTPFFTDNTNNLKLNEYLTVKFQDSNSQANKFLSIFQQDLKTAKSKER